jgi:hypothetical protein
MQSKLERGQFVHVVATVDLAKHTGEIRYVNPATTGISTTAPGSEEVELSVEDATGAKKKTWHPVVRFPSSEDGNKPTIGLIQEDIPREPWMKVLRLSINGQEVSKYEAGASPPAAAAGATLGAAPGAAAPSLALEAAGSDRPHRRQLRINAGPQPRQGVTYTVQVKPDGADAWQTISVGRDTPATEIDRNQFPGSREVDVRVLQTTGFDERVLAEQKLDLEK